MIISFGYTHGAPTASRISKIFDVRELTHNTSSPEFTAKLHEIIDYGRAHDGDIAIGCDKGHHRSVVLANKAASALRTSVYLRDKSR